LAAIFSLIDRGLVGALAGFAFGHFMQSRRDTTKYERDKEAADVGDKRRLRDAKLERIREAFRVVLSSSWGIATAAAEMRWTYEGESDDAKRDRINELLDEAMEGINRARSLLALEEDMDNVLTEFQTLRVAFLAFTSAMNAAAEDHDAVGERAAERKTNDEKIKKGTEALEKMLREKLAKLEKSV
jgi:hypothetical protein